MLFLLLLIIAAALAAYKLLPVFSGGHQAFTDIILENVSASGYNKSGELALFWFLLFGGCLLLVVMLIRRFHRMPQQPGQKSPRKAADIIDLPNDRFPLYGFLCLIPFLVSLIAFGQFNVPLLAGSVIFILCYRILPGCRRLTKRILLIYALTYYAWIACLTVLTRLIKWDRLSSLSRLFSVIQSSTFIYTAALTTGTLLSAILILRYKNHPDTSLCRRFLLILQCPLPALLTLWLVDDYLYQGEIIRVPYATGYTVFFVVFIGISFFLVLRQLAVHWSKKETDWIGAITPILIFVYHSFSAAPMYAQPDQHHHGEQLIPWNQVFAHGQSLYDEYTPVSGLFPFVNGLIQHLFLDGTVTDYSPAISITMVIFCILTMYLICRHVGTGYATAFAILFTLPSYNRQYMVLPALLLLSLPGLLKKPNRWLQTWIFVCFLSGLYYPLYGAGILLGTLPLGIRQAIVCVKSGAFKKELRRPSFFLPWSGLLLLIFLSLPLLIRMLKHTLTFSSQTVLADGITLLGQTAPDSFLPFLASHEALRNACYLSFRFLLPMLGVWIFVYFICHAARKRKLTTALLLFSGAAVLMISYTYTLVRADTGKILSRTAMILVAVAGMFLPILLIRCQGLLHKRFSSAFIIGALVSLPMAIYMQVSWTKFPDMWVYPDGESQLVMDDSAKLYSYYEVPDTFLKAEDTGLSDTYQALLGRGFMVADQLHYIEDYAAVIEKCAAVRDDVSYMALDGQGFYDYLGVTCAATGYIPAARSYEAQTEIWNAASENLPVVFDLQLQSSYYIFRFMLEDGYIYCAKDKAFYPPKLYALLYDGDGDDYRADAAAADFGKSAASFGASMASLQDLFVTDQTVSLSDGSLPESFTGTDYDFLYLEFDKDTLEAKTGSFDALASDVTLQISWTDTSGTAFENSYADCILTEDCRLLIPMGMNACWLLSEMDDFKLTVTLAGSDTAEDAGEEVLFETTYKRLKTSGEDSALLKELSLMQLDIRRSEN